MHFLWVALLAAGAGGALVPAVWQGAVAVPGAPCDGFACGDLQRSTADGFGVCFVPVAAVVGFAPPSPSPSPSSSPSEDLSASLFVAARRGQAGACQRAEGVAVRAAFGSRLAASSVTEERAGAETIGYRVRAQFEPGSPHYYLNVAYSCQALTHINLLDKAHSTAVLHQYKLALSFLTMLGGVRIPVVSVDVVFPFANASILADVTLPKRKVEDNQTIFTFDGANVDVFNVVFSFLYSQYDPTCGESVYGMYLRYGLIGGSIVGAIAIVAAAAWFIVKKLIKKKTTSAFRMLGQDIDLLTDGETTDNEMENVVEDLG